MRNDSAAGGRARRRARAPPTAAGRAPVVCDNVIQYIVGCLDLNIDFPVLRQAWPRSLTAPRCHAVILAIHCVARVIKTWISLRQCRTILCNTTPTPARSLNMVCDKGY